MGNITSKIRTSLVSFVETSIYIDLTNTKDTDKSNKVLYALINAYNHWQGEEHNKADYLFNLNDKNDLITCIQGGLTAEDIALLQYYRKHFGLTKYFLFGENYPKPQELDVDSITDIMVVNITEIVNYTLAYGQRAKTTEFDYIYQNYIAPLFITNND